MEQDFDLFGDPVFRSDGRRGRPAHRPTQKLRNKVMVLLALGWANDRIAAALHCSVPTLKKYYFSELKRRSIQRDRLEAWRFEKIIEQVEAGSVSAMKELGQMIEKNDRMHAAARLVDGPEPREQAIGKKEKARRDASEAMEGGGIWGDDLKPGVFN